MNLCISQARLSSTRLPQKVLQSLGEETILGLHLKRLQCSKKVDRLILAIGEEEGHEKLQKICQEKGVEYQVGSVSDVLERFYIAAKNYRPQTIIRVTSDCPLIDPVLLDNVISFYEQGQFDFVSNCAPPFFPDGMDVEIFSFELLEMAYQNATQSFEREHVTPYIREKVKEKGFSKGSFSEGENLSDYRLTVDTEEDLKVVRKLVQEVGEMGSMLEYIHYLDLNPDVREMNARFERNFGSQRG